jgi:hypothetical protein
MGNFSTGIIYSYLRRLAHFEFISQSFSNGRNRVFVFIIQIEKIKSDTNFAFQVVEPWMYEHA